MSFVDPALAASGSLAHAGITDHEAHEVKAIKWEQLEELTLYVALSVVLNWAVVRLFPCQRQCIASHHLDGVDAVESPRPSTSHPADLDQRSPGDPHVGVVHLDNPVVVRGGASGHAYNPE